MATTTLNIENIIKKFPFMGNVGLAWANEVNGELHTSSEYDLNLELWGVTDDQIIAAGKSTEGH